MVSPFIKIQVTSASLLAFAKGTIVNGVYQEPLFKDILECFELEPRDYVISTSGGIVMILWHGDRFHVMEYLSSMEVSRDYWCSNIRELRDLYTRILVQEWDLSPDEKELEDFRLTESICGLIGSLPLSTESKRMVKSVTSLACTILTSKLRTWGSSYGGASNSTRRPCYVS